MYDENDFVAVAKFLRLGVKIHFTNPMGQNPSFTTTFPSPKGDLIKLNEKSLYDMERKMRVLFKMDDPVKTKLAPFAYLGTNFRGLLYCTRGSNEYILQETHTLLGTESNRVVRSAELFIQLLS